MSDDIWKDEHFDIMKNMCVSQGYVPVTCTMIGQMVFALMNETGDPCKECNEDRSKCKGRQLKEEK